MADGKLKLPVILVIESDNETRPLLVENLSRHGYQVLAALDEEEALLRLQNSPELPVLILMNQVDFTVEEVLTQGQRLRVAGNLDAHVPLVVMADHYGPELEGTVVQSSEYDYVIYPEDAQQLLNLLWRLQLDA